MKTQIAFLLSFSLSAIAYGQGYNFVGSSSDAAGDCFILTQAQPWQNGAIWYDEPIDISEPFQLQFTASFGTIDALGADGMVFVMQQVGNNVIGASGQGMGFGGFSPSLGVEFDSYQNFDFGDPAYDHMAILSNGNANHNLPGNLVGPIPISANGPNVEDGQDYIIDISWNPSSNLFSVSVNCELRLQININLQTAIFSNNQDVFWGFTGATGGEFNEQKICLDPLILGLPESYDACVNEPVQLEAPAASFGTVSWEPAQYLDNPNSFSPVAIVEETTTFTLTFEDLCGNQQTQETTLIVAEPSVDLGADISECTDGEVILTATGQFDEIQWFDESTEPSVGVSESGEYYVDVIQGICLATDTVEVTLDSPPVYEGETIAELCEGEVFNFELGNPNATILWFDNSTETTRAFDQAGNYPFTLTNGLCSEEFVLTVNVTETPDFTLGPDITDCGDNPVTIPAPDDYDQITWFDGSQGPSVEVSGSGTYWADINQGNCQASDTIEVELDAPPVYNGATEIDLCEGEEYMFILNNTNADIIWFDNSTDETRTFSEEGSYTFELVNGECSSEFTLEVVINEIPEFSLGPDLNFCENTTALLQPSVEFDLTWSDGSTGSDLSVGEEGQYWATATENGCSFSDTIIVTAVEIPDLSISGTTKLCPEEQGSLLAESSGLILWSTGATTNEIAITTPGFYSVESINEEGCVATSSVSVIALSLPSISPIADILKCQDKTEIVRAVSSDNRNLVWSDGNRGETIRIENAGYYAVELSNECGSTRREFQVAEEECFNQFYLPNAFTPDEDGLNDLFKGSLSDYVSFQLRIFNRFGDLVFETSNPEEGWNGSYRNNSFYCPADVYVVRYSIDFGENELLDGFSTVVLIR